MIERSDADDANDVSFKSLVILLPVFNDWEALGMLLDKLDRVLLDHEIEADVLVVNDCSTAPFGKTPSEGTYHAIARIDILELRQNLGHQRAIAIGLTHIERNRPCAAVLLMDSDGEDDPNDIPKLLAKLKEHAGRKIVFAERRRRSENLTFRVFYLLYRTLHYLLIGHGVRVGNFSVIPRERLSTLVVVSEMWNHYAAAVFKARIPFDTVPTRRAKRLDGKSKMNFVNLVIHGLSAISVYGDIVGVRLLVAASGLIVATTFALACTVAVRLWTEMAIPGWATSTVGVLVVILLQAIMFCIVFSFMILGDRNRATFLPIRDYAYYIDRLREVYSR